MVSDAEKRNAMKRVGECTRDGLARGLSSLLLAGLAAAQGATPSFQEQVEADWLLREGYRQAPGLFGGEISTRDDAGGGVDGVIDGYFGFHTDREANPWWQVDLGGSRAIATVRVFNRTDGASERAGHLRLQLSDDGETWREVYRHDGTPFSGHPEGAPLEVSLTGEHGRYLRLQLPGTSYLHLDEVQVFGPESATENLALKRPADQSSVSQWSTPTVALPGIDWPSCGADRVAEILEHGRRLAAELERGGMDCRDERSALDEIARTVEAAPAEEVGEELYLRARWVRRRLLFADRLLDFDRILFAKRVPGSFNHMSDQYLGWWSRPGGGIFTLEGFAEDRPRDVCLTESFTEPGSFLRPILSHDGRRVLFAWCRHYPGLAAEPNKLEKDNVPEDAFYHLFEMNVDGSGVRRLTRGKYDDFDGRYLPDGRIVFLSTRRGQSLQCGRESARRTIEVDDLPDAYVRCGGGPERPCAVYTLHTIDADGGDLNAISPFEMFEWTPSVAHDGSILYSRWDYIDRDNMPYMSLWATNPDGTNAHLVYGNNTTNLHCTFEPRCIPNSSKIVFTASAHHAQTKGSLVLLDPSVGTEGAAPITRLTPEVPFPEAEAWPLTYYANPWPLSERLYLVTWSDEGVTSQGKSNGWDRWHSVQRPVNGTGLYLFDAAGDLELLYRDPAIGCFNPMPLRPRPRPFPIGAVAERTDSEEGRFLLVDVYRGLEGVERGAVHALRLVAVPPKTHPTMNFPNLGITRDDPGKCVLGTVPVETDGSAYFRAPAGVIVFFQALDERGMAIQTMRTTTHVQPGQTLSCIGCHESRGEAPAAHSGVPLAARREPSRITPGPSGSWPLSFDELIQPLLNRECVSCHSPESTGPLASPLDLTTARAYESLIGYGEPSLVDHVWRGYRAGHSTPGACAASRSPLLALLLTEGGHHEVELAPEDLERLILWMDTYAQRAGSFDAAQEEGLLELRREVAGLLAR